MIFPRGKSFQFDNFSTWINLKPFQNRVFYNRSGRIPALFPKNKRIRRWNEMRYFLKLDSFSFLVRFAVLPLRTNPHNPKIHFRLTSWPLEIESQRFYLSRSSLGFLCSIMKTKAKEKSDFNKYFAWNFLQMSDSRTQICVYGITWLFFWRIHVDAIINRIKRLDEMFIDFDVKCVQSFLLQIGSFGQDFFPKMPLRNCESSKTGKWILLVDEPSTWKLDFVVIIKFIRECNLMVIKSIGCNIVNGSNINNNVTLRQNVWLSCSYYF